MQFLELFSDYWLAMLLAAVLAYALGSVNSAIIISGIAKKRDIRKYGGGNAGATNVMRTFGAGLGAVTFICDVLKGAAAAGLAYLLAGILVPGGDGAWEVAYLGTLCGVLGHMFPVFFAFRGGKGVSTALGALLVLDWRMALCCLAVFIIAVILTRMVSVGSMAAAVSVPIFTFIFNRFVSASPDRLTVCGTVLMAVMVLIVIIRHGENIKRIIKGTESRLSFGGGKTNKNTQ